MAIFFTSDTYFGHRALRVDGPLAYMPLTRGFEAILDAEDAHLVCGAKWCAQVAPGGRRVYATRVLSPRSLGYLLMHRVICEVPAGLQVDHINGNGLDNRRANLRLATAAQNQHNRSISINNTSGFKGVYWSKSVGKWAASIRLNRRKFHLGHFSSPEEAHRAYVAASVRLHGEFGRSK